MKIGIALFIVFFSLQSYAQINFEDVSSSISKNRNEYIIRNGTVTVNQAINPVENAVIIIRNNGRLNFGPNAVARFGSVKRDASGNIVRNSLGLPIVENPVTIIEDENAGTWGNDNFNQSTNTRFRTGSNVSFEGVNYLVKTTNGGNHFDVRQGANVNFIATRLLIDSPQANFPHFGSTGVVMDGFVIDNRSNPTAMEIVDDGIPSTINGLELVDNNPGSNTRHFVFIRNTDTRYELDNLNVRNISFFEGASFIGQLNNPIGNTLKSTNNLGGVLEVHRDLNLSAATSDNVSLNGTNVFIDRVNNAASFSSTLQLDADNKTSARLLQYLVPHNSQTPTNRNDYQVSFATYNYNWTSFTHTLDYDASRNGDNAVEGILLTPDTNLTKSQTDAASISGLSITHNPSILGGTISISASVSLCDLYDFSKLNKLSNRSEPSFTSLTATPTGNEIAVGDYQLVFNNGAELLPCGKFQKITSTATATFDAIADNLKVALTDASGSYKLINLIGLTDANVQIRDENNNTLLAEETNFTGELNLVVQSNSNNVSVSVTRANYTNWGADIDLNTSDVFTFKVNQSQAAGASATLANQEQIIFYAQKLLQKQEGVLERLHGVTPNLNINSVNQSATFSTQEKQEEVLQLLKRILAKQTAINETFNQE